MDVEHLFNHFIKPNCDLYNIEIDDIFKEFYIYLESQNYCYPSCDINSLRVNTIKQGKDFCFYKVKCRSDNSKYWKKINKIY